MKVIIDKDIEDLIPKFMQKRNEDVLSIQELIKNKDFSGIRTIAHRITGTSLAYGFNNIAEVARGIETYARDEKLDEIVALFEKYKSIIENIDIEYE